jgi:hypothetical protein
MKKLFLAIFIPIAVILGTPALVATLMYDGTGDEHMPVHLYTDEYDFETMLFTELNNSIEEVETGVTNDLIFNLHSDMINRMIFESIRENNPDYAPGEGCVTDQECYIFANPVEAEGYNFDFRVVGMWVSFYDGETATDPGRFTFNIFLEVNLNDGLQYKTVIELHFLFEDDIDYYYLEFDKVQMGRLPVPKSFFTTVIGVIESQGGVDLEEQLSEMPLGDLDLNNLTYIIEKDDILASMTEGEGAQESGAKLMQQLLSIVFEENLVNFELQDDEFVLSAGVSKFRSEDETEIPAYLYDLHDQTVEGTETVIGEFNPELFQPDVYIQNLFTEFIFNNALLGGGFEIDEETFNKLVYANASGFSDTRQTVEIDTGDGTTKMVELGLKAIWFEFETDGIYAKALFSIADIDSLLVLRADETSSSTTELYFEFVTITAGQDSGEQDGDYLSIDDMAAFQAVFADLGDVEFGTFNEQGDLVISTTQLSALMQEGSAEGAVEVTAIDLADGAIVLTVEPADDNFVAALNAFQDAMETVLGDNQLMTNLGGVLDVTDGGTEQAVYEAVQDIQDTLNDPLGEVTSEQIEDLFTNFDDLDTGTQQQFLDTIVDLIDPTTVGDFETIFGGFGAETPVE